jgi:hypothetical protein
MLNVIPRTTTKNVIGSQVPEAHACNPSYSGGRNQEDHGLKPTQANSSQDPITKKSITKIGPVEWLKVKGLSSNLSIAIYTHIYVYMYICVYIIGKFKLN